MRMMTGATKITPIRELETNTGLPTLKNGQSIKVLIKAAKFMRLHSHPMNARMNQPTKRRLKRSSFIHQSRILEKQDSELLARPRAPSHPTKYFHSLQEKGKVPSHQGEHPRNRKQKNPDRPRAEITDPWVYQVQLPSEQMDPRQNRWVCYCSNQRWRRWTVHQVQRRGIKHLTSNWKVLNKLQSRGQGPESSSNRSQEQPAKSAQENCYLHWCAFSTPCSTEPPQEGPEWTHHCSVSTEPPQEGPEWTHHCSVSWVHKLIRYSTGFLPIAEFMETRRLIDLPKKEGFWDNKTDRSHSAMKRPSSRPSKKSSGNSNIPTTSQTATTEKPELN